MSSHIIHIQPLETRREKLIASGIDKYILAILDTPICTPRAEQVTILDTLDRRICPVSGAPASTTEPSFAVVRAVDDAVALYRLDLDRKRKLFGVLGWQFECLACKGSKTPNHFQQSSFVLWGSTEPARVHLRSGPCVACREKASNGGGGGGLVAYTVKSPKRANP